MVIDDKVPTNIWVLVLTASGQPLFDLYSGGNIRQRTMNKAKATDVVKSSRRLSI